MASSCRQPRPAAILVCAACVLLAVDGLAAAARRIAWEDVAPFHARLQAQGLTASTFDTYVERLGRTGAERVRDGDLEHLVHFVLQSGAFTSRPPLEPALAAQTLVDGLPPAERTAFLAGGDLPAARLPPAVRGRMADLLRALDGPAAAAAGRLADVRAIAESRLPDGAPARESALAREFFRVARFLYQKEFGAAAAAPASGALAELYQQRGLSTDTAVEAGYLVSIGLGILKGLDGPARIRRVLIVGPGLDLAPRTALADERPAVSYQPWAVIDALLALRLADEEELDVVAADINPRVVAHLQRAAAEAPTLTFSGEIRETDRVRLTDDYRAYLADLGRALGATSDLRTAGGALARIVRVRPEAAAVLDAAPLDILTERLTGAPFDLVIATNILPYFDDTAVALAVTNIAHMLAPGGWFLHNERRPLLGDLAAAAGLPFDHARHATIATVEGAPPLYDAVFLHRRARR